ncbi:C40 family peptidase [Streptacidiphilus rugosus]|uniref:C40 family peptidase n=1 Tax=Streptacidiphilus rugosus TaxID=405783 RepID=UPI0009FE9611|nr:NlpC/P60 family protein [Streptacidiphilus rugosus]
MGRRPWLRGVLRCGLLLAAVSLAVLPAGTATAAPTGGSGGTTATGGTAALTQAEQTLLPILNRLHSLYQQMETATQKYDAMSEQLTQAQTDVLELQVQVQNAQTQLDAGTELAGALASQQYRDGDISDLTRLLFADNPQALMSNKELLDAAAHSQAQLITQLADDRAALVGAQSAAVDAQQRVAQLVTAQGKVKDGINKELTGVEQLVSNLTGAQRSELSQLEQQQASAAQLALLASGVLGKDGAKPSAAGAAAVAYAFAQLGKPYVWGGSGPTVFDCSGLTSQAWLHAGVPIPRTSEEQWAQLTHVPLNQLRPGDLILYFTGASHVAIYIGGGLVIQSPHPGAFVDIAPIAQNPILGAVRPDPQNPSLGSYTPPTAPAGASNPQPIGPVAPPAPTPKPVPTPTPKPTGAPTGSPTPKPTPTPTGTPTGAPSGSPSGTPSPSPSDSTSVSASPSASVSASSRSSAAASPSAKGEPSGTPAASASGSAAAGR